MKEPKGTILIVEDQEHDVEFMKRAFGKAGIDNPVRTVDNGEDAIAYLTGEGKFADRAAYPLPRVIVTDIKMPQMGGIELLDWIRRHPEHGVVPTIVLSSSVLPSDVKAAFAHGAMGYFVKPDSLAELQRLVRIIADYWRAGRTPPP